MIGIFLIAWSMPCWCRRETVAGSSMPAATATCCDNAAAIWLRRGAACSQRPPPPTSRCTRWPPNPRQLNRGSASTSDVPWRACRRRYRCCKARSTIYCAAWLIGTFMLAIRQTSNAPPRRWYRSNRSCRLPKSNGWSWKYDAKRSSAVEPPCYFACARAHVLAGLGLCVEWEALESGRMEGTVAPQRAGVSPIMLGNQRHQRIALGSQLGHASKAPLAKPVTQQGAVFEVQFPQLTANGVKFDAGHRWPFRWLFPHHHLAILGTGKRRSDGGLMLTVMISRRRGWARRRRCLGKPGHGLDPAKDGDGQNHGRGHGAPQRCTERCQPTQVHISRGKQGDKQPIATGRADGEDAAPRRPAGRAQFPDRHEYQQPGNRQEEGRGFPGPSHPCQMHACSFPANGGALNATEREALGDIVAHEIDHERTGNDGQRARGRQQAQLVSRAARGPRHGGGDRLGRNRGQRLGQQQLDP